MNPRPSSALDRRRFLQLSSASAIAAAFGHTRAQSATDASAALYAKLVPFQKNLPLPWITSLVTTGHPLDAPIQASKQNQNLHHIGMPVGGIACGTVYLAGDGRLFIWDIFNQPHTGVVDQQVEIPKGFENIAGGGPKVRAQDGSNYLNPPTPDSHPNPFKQSFGLTVAGQTRKFQASDWTHVEFDGKWPLGTVRYRDPACPLHAELHAWTPFIPLDLTDSSLPVTIIDLILHNPGDTPIEASLTGVLENACNLHTRNQHDLKPSSETRRLDGITVLFHTASPAQAASPSRPDIPFEDFENGYGQWQATGTAFGQHPARKSNIPDYQGNLAIHGNAAVNTHASAPGNSVESRDHATGTLTSPEFTISRKFIHLLIGGGNHPNETCIQLLIDQQPVRSLTGKANNLMQPATLTVAEFEGRKAQLRIIDSNSGPWGNIGIDHIVFSDQPATNPDLLEDSGSMALATTHPDASSTPDSLTVPTTVPAGASTRTTFLITWHFPNLHPLPGLGKRQHHYAKRFTHAAHTATDTAQRLPTLRQTTMKWVENYYNSSIPRWLLDRAAAPTNTLQTTNCLILDDGRFWAWEGIGCCAGTCAHVWHYAQGPARWFPELERNLRLVTDFGVALNPDGAVRFRAESGGIAIDAQAGVILRTWREHLTSANPAFLHQAWPGARKATEWLIRFDTNDPNGLDGLLHGEQHNTLDAEWFGKIHALCSLYLAALLAAAEMADRANDPAFAAKCRAIANVGKSRIQSLFNGEFFIQEEDPAHAHAIGVGKGCYIDQVIGQWWAHLTGLGHIIDPATVESALHSLWHYNFLPDVGPFRSEFKRGRFYAMPGEAGLVMCTWPKGGLRPDFTRHWQYAYFNECMTGFEWQAASHMIFTGAPVSGSNFESAIDNPTDPRSLTLRGLAVGRAIHDRYAPARRNPYNEIECSDHYARAAASYAMLLAVCGFEYDGPAGILGFNPKLNPQSFRAPFTTAAGWGSFHQQAHNTHWSATLTLLHGTLKLTTLRLPWLTPQATLTLAGKPVEATCTRGSATLTTPLTLHANETLAISSP